MIEAIKALFQWLADVIVGAFNALMAWLAIGLQLVLDIIVPYWNVFWAWFTLQINGLWSDIWDTLEDTFEEVISWAGGYLGDLWDWVNTIAEAQGIDLTGTIESFATAGQTLADVYSGMAWLFPINTCLGIFAASYALSAAIRFGRWVIAAIPWTFGA